MVSKQEQRQTNDGRRHCLLMAAIQLSCWVPLATAASSSLQTFSDELLEYPMNDQDNYLGSGHDDEDPCKLYKSCSSCTFARFQYKALDRIRRSKPSCNWCPFSSTCYCPSKHPEAYCVDRHNHNAPLSIEFEYDCPLGPTPYPDNPPSLLPNWMGAFYQAGLLDYNSGNGDSAVRLIDLTLPGSHDSLSYDLSLTVSEDGIDNLTRLASLLHKLSGGMLHLLPGDLEEFFRMQGKTQQLTMPQQLDNGIRFVDFRIMYEPDKAEWYSIHFMQSKRPAEDYLRQIRTWLEDHPHEVIVIWLSKHGSTSATGDDQYAGVTPAQKQQFWNKYCQTFDGLMQNTNETSIFTTPLGELIERNYRVISYVSDYKEFTQSSPLALDAANIQNAFDDGQGVFDEETLLQRHIDYFKNATVNNKQVNANDGFTLLAMNTASSSWQAIAAAKRQFLHWLKNNDNVYKSNDSTDAANVLGPHKYVRSVSNEQLAQEEQPSVQYKALSSLQADSSLERTKFSVVRQLHQWLGIPLADDQHDLEDSYIQADLFHSCASHIKIPGVDKWCPLNLLDISQLASYYNQVAIEEAYKNSFESDNDDTNNQHVLSAFPNAFYLDVLDYDGTIRTGSQLLDGTERGDTNITTKDARYALVDTLLAYNAKVLCRREAASHAGCDDLIQKIEARRSRYPVIRWKEPELGRHDDWPPYTYDLADTPIHSD